MEVDVLDHLAAEAFDGYIVRKDPARRFRDQYPVPTYVGELLLGLLGVSEAGGAL